MNQQELAEWIKGGKIIKRVRGFHCTWGLCDYTLTVEHGDCVYLIAELFDPSKPEGERATFEQPILIQHEVQTELRL